MAVTAPGKSGPRPARPPGKNGDGPEQAAAGDTQISKRTLALIISPLGLLLISAVRLIIVSDYNTTTAVTIASSGGYVNALLGSIVPLVPVFAPYLALLLLLFRRFFLSIIAFVIAAFITPTPISMADMARLAKADWHHLLGQAPTLSAINPEQFLLLIVVLLIIGAFWVYQRSLGEAVSVVLVIVVTIALLLTRPGTSPSVPVTLRLAGNGEHHLLTWTPAQWLVIVPAALLAVYFLSNYYRTFPRILSVVIAIVAAIALFPYVVNIYPFPRNRGYYVEVLHELWLPAEQIVLSSGRVYSGYVLSSSGGWLTLLQTDKTIIYLHAGDVVSRSVCEPATDPKPPPYPPLISLLYTKPPHTLACGSSQPATLTFIRSRGQSLREISSVIRRPPAPIISVTNAYQHDRISAALRAYESAHDWNAPTPPGQRFWYFLQITP